MRLFRSVASDTLLGINGRVRLNGQRKDEYGFHQNLAFHGPLDSSKPCSLHEALTAIQNAEDIKILPEFQTGDELLRFSLAGQYEIEITQDQIDDLRKVVDRILDKPGKYGIKVKAVDPDEYGYGLQGGNN